MIKQSIHRPQSWVKLIPLAVILLAFALRLYRLDSQSFAFDEGWTSYAIHHSWRAIWGVLAPDNHPPLYYVLIKALAGLAGYTDFPVRFASVMFGTALVAGLYALGRRLGGETMGLSAALFAACVPSLVYYAQEARMYSLLMALAVLSSYSLLRIDENPRCRRWWIAYVLATSSALYTHYFAALLLLTHSVVWLLRSIWGLSRPRFAPRGAGGFPPVPAPRSEPERQPEVACDLGRTRSGVQDYIEKARSLFGVRVRWWILGQGAILVSYLPWLRTAIHQVRIGQGTWWRMPLPASAILKDIWRFFVLGPRRPVGVPPFGSLLGPVALAGLIGALVGWRLGRRAWAFALITLALPIGLMVLIGSHLPIYTDRYTLVAAPGLALVVGLGIAACWEASLGRWTWLGRVTALILLVVALAGPLPQLRAHYANPTYWREDFRRAAIYLMDKSSSTDTVILVGCSQPIMHYYRGPAEVLRFPQRGDSVQGEEEVISLLREHVNAGGAVRLVMYSWQTVDPQDLVEYHLRARCEFRGEHWQVETGQRPIRVMNFVACDPDFAAEPRRSFAATWDDQVALSAYRLADVAPGKRAHVVLWWRTLRRPDRDYSAFVHLLDAQGEMITQSDKLPLSDFYPMRAWPLNVDQRDEYLLKIPKEADLGGAWLAIGLYDARTGRRLSVSQDGVPLGDYVRLPVAQ